MTTTPEQLQEFEAAFKEIFPQWIKFERDSLGYQSPSVEAGFKLWQASRKQVLEEAYAIYEQAQELSHVKDGLRELLK